ncbi:MAG: hypothetical protein N2645_13855 [Clostridia bacterium]|nr:hypothetical protein [Clostridia bacterium]
MVNRIVLTKEQAMYALNHGEFDSSVIASKGIVIVIMTQDWCPQWGDMRRWIYNMSVEAEIDIYELIYNKVDYSREFMRFKETTFKNDQIPYLRYYKDGKLMKETNYVSEQKVRDILGV